MSRPVDIRPADLAIVHSILQDTLPKDARVWVFGSRAKWTTKDSSDLDLAIDAGRALTRKEQLELSEAFEESDLPYKVDVVDMQTVSESFKALIERDKVVLPLEAGQRVLPTGSIPSDWDSAYLKDISVKIGSGSTPTGGEKVYLSRRHNYALIRSQCVFDRYFDKGSISFISDEDASRMRNVNVERGDILLNITGDGITFGRASLVPEGVLPACVNQHVAIIRPDKKKISSGFLLSYLTHRKVKEYIEGFNSGGSRRALTKAHIERFLVPLPPLIEQNAIASILGALDDKIELNRKTNATLEAMARALFKSWFVDFDPVKAKMEGRQPFGMDAATAALFPSRLDQEEKPEGWDYSTLERIADLNPESWSRRNFPDQIKYVDLANTKWGEIQSIELHSHDTAPSRAQRILRKGDTIVGTVRPGNGSYAFIGEDGLTASTGFAILRPKTDRYREAVYLAVTVKENIERLAHLADGGAYPAVRPEVVLQTPVIFPGDEILSEFSKRTLPLMDRIEASKAEASLLAQLRDYLLPKLISGDIRIRDVEKFVGAA